MREELLASNLSLTKVLNILGYRHEKSATSKMLYSQDVFNKETGELLFTGTASNVVEWLCPGFWKKYHGEEQFG